MASDKVWWGAGEESEDTSAVVRCERLSDDGWSLRVDNSVGLIVLPDLQFVVQPKIPVDHFLFLYSQALALPRMRPQKGTLAQDSSLIDIVVDWFLTACEQLLRSGLLLDYRDRIEDLSSARGAVQALGTAELYYSGRLTTLCEFEDFNIDTPLNRVVLAGARAVLQNRLMSHSLRHRAALVVGRMDGVGRLQESDLLVRLDRRTAGYREAITLATQVLHAIGRSLKPGSHRL